MINNERPRLVLLSSEVSQEGKFRFSRYEFRKSAKPHFLKVFRIIKNDDFADFRKSYLQIQKKNHVATTLLRGLDLITEHPRYPTFSKLSF